MVVIAHVNWVMYISSLRKLITLLRVLSRKQKLTFLMVNRVIKRNCECVLQHDVFENQIKNCFALITDYFSIIRNKHLDFI